MKLCGYIHIHFLFLKKTKKTGNIGESRNFEVSPVSRLYMGMCKIGKGVLQHTPDMCFSHVIQLDVLHSGVSF